ncbi:MAG: iron transporter [Acidimicrobiales bacterium]
MKRMNVAQRVVAVTVVALSAATGPLISFTSLAGATAWPSNLVSSSDCKKYLTSNSSARVATTHSYIEVAVLGPRETMYTPAQAAKKHPTSGEVMVSGQMGNGSSMTMGMSASMAHLEVHICSKKSGAAVTNVMPTMTLKSSQMKAKADVIPVAVMRGLSGAIADTHYGNNVVVVPGGRYHLLVTTMGETARFTLHSQKMSG